MEDLASQQIFLLVVVLAGHLVLVLLAHSADSQILSVMGLLVEEGEEVPLLFDSQFHLLGMRYFGLLVAP